VKRRAGERVRTRLRFGRARTNVADRGMDGLMPANPSSGGIPKFAAFFVLI